MKRIALYHFETLLWISRLGTFRAAAERMNTSQPAISARVREIEEQLGIAIFQRQGRNMVLTARGRRLVQECEPLWAGFEKVLLSASGFEGASGLVRIGSGEIAAASCLPGFVHAVERDLPGVTLELELDLTARMFQQLLGGTIDLAFLAGPVASPASGRRRSVRSGSSGPRAARRWRPAALLVRCRSGRSRTTPRFTASRSIRLAPTGSPRVRSAPATTCAC
jgi:DNA-binding transcriptional LysR family regulator